MAYEKRVCVLKQIRKGFSADGNALSGVVYAERMGDELTLTPRIPGLSPVREGGYVLALRAEEKFFFVPLTEGSVKLSPSPSLRRGIAVLLCFVRGEAEPVAYGCCGEESGDYQPLLAALRSDGRKKPVPTPMPPVQPPAPLAPNVPYAPGVPLPGKEEEKAPFREQALSYDDEAIAASDYFLRDADEAGEARDGAETETGESGGHPDAHEAVLLPHGTLTYYKEVREKLGRVLKEYPRDTRLLWAFPQSEWARSGEGLIGIVYEEGIPRYLCVAAEGECPEDMKEDAVFVPSTPFSEEKGFWVVFQDADTGAYVKVQRV